MSKPYATAQDVYDTLAAKYGGTAYAMLPQVANATGMQAGRWLDAIVASLWPSRGLWFHGFEIKVSRGDWIRELKQAEKAETHFQHCDYFSLAVHDAEIVQAGELPETWGLVECDVEAKRVHVVKEAPRSTTPGAPLDRGFAMALFRSFDKAYVSRLVETNLKAEFARGQDAGRRDAEHERKERGSRAEQVERFLETYESVFRNSDRDVVTAGWTITNENAVVLARLLAAWSDADNYGRLKDMREVMEGVAAAFAVLEDADVFLVPPGRRRRKA